MSNISAIFKRFKKHLYVELLPKDCIGDPLIFLPFGNQKLKDTYFLELNDDSNTITKLSRTTFVPKRKVAEITWRLFGVITLKFEASKANVSYSSTLR